MQTPATTSANSRARPARERILLTAHDLFYRDGIRSTGIDIGMLQAIAALLPRGRRRESLARGLALVVGGSIVQAQFRSDPEAVLKDLRQLVTLIGGERAHAQSSL
jgi:hypothetical protein